MRSLKQTLAVILLATLSLGLPSVVAADLEEGKHYEVISQQLSCKPKVTEYFNYGCGACYNSEKFVNDWKKNKPDNIEFELVALELNPAWKVYVEAYYIAEMLGVLEKTHTRTFHRIHVEKKPITTRESLKAFYVSLGVDAKRFAQAASSFQLNTNIHL